MLWRSVADLTRTVEQKAREEGGFKVDKDDPALIHAKRVWVPGGLGAKQDWLHWPDHRSGS